MSLTLTFVVLPAHACYRFVEEIHVECSMEVEYGSGEYGGWSVCLAGPYHPQPPCLVYSFG